MSYRHSCNALFYCKKVSYDSRPYNSDARPVIALLLRAAALGVGSEAVGIEGSGEQRVRQAKLARSSGWKSRLGKV